MSVRMLEDVIDELDECRAKLNAAEAQVAELTRERDGEKLAAETVHSLYLSMIAQVAELQKDAERLDWMILEVEQEIVPRFWYASTEDYLVKYRAAIDAAKESGNER